VRKKHPNKNPCTSTASGGTFRCVLELGHPGVHTTSTAGRKAPQYATWLADSAGVVRVITYSRGKKMGEWPEEPPAAPPRPMTLEDEPADEEADAAAIAAMDLDDLDDEPAKPGPCGTKLARVGTCKLLAAHTGDHFTEKSGEAYAWNDAGEENSWEVCGSGWSVHPSEKGKTKVPKERQTICQRPGEHDGPHRGLDDIGNHMSEWEGDGGTGGCHRPKTKINLTAELLGRADVDAEAEEDNRRAQEPPAFVGSVEEFAKHVDKKPSLADSCPKCGRELGEHDGAACPKPYGYVIVSRGEMLCHDDALQGGEFRDSNLVGAAGYKAKVFKTKSAATQKAHHLGRITEILPWWGSVEAKRAPEPRTPPPPPTFALDQISPPARGWNCMCPGVGDRHMMGDADCQLETNGSVRQSAPSVQALVATAAVGGTEAVSIGHHVRGEGPKILGYRRHPAAALFPLLEGPELAALGESIATNGLRDPIVRVTVGGETYILDGSNRGVACEQRGIQPRFIDYEGPKDTASLIAYSLDKNGDGRRHLDPSVRAMIAVEASKLMPRGNPGDRETGRSAGLLTQAEAGKRMGVSDRLIRRAVVVRDKGTAKVNEAVMKGKLSVDAALKATKGSAAMQDKIASEALAKKSGQLKGGRVDALVRQEEKRAVVRKINEQRVAPAPFGPFGVIVIDPPWPYENSDQHDGSRGHIDYPPMPIGDICELRSVLDPRAKKDCVLGMWVTNAFIHEVGSVLAAWGFTHRTMYTWDKELEGVGSWGRGRTEHLVIASRGEVTHTLNEISTLLSSRRREHSRKPDEMYALLAKHCSGPMIDMFSREARDGWAAWGAETQKFETEAA
jgi:N6-adenosine-specific RNA methylase IME4